MANKFKDRSPFGRLLEICQHRNNRYPIPDFSPAVKSSCDPLSFTVKVTVGGFSVTGVGNTAEIARRVAAETMIKKIVEEKVYIPCDKFVFKGETFGDPQMLLTIICQHREYRYPLAKYRYIKKNDLFHASVTVGPVTAEGQGPSIVAAKLHAAKSMLHKILDEKVHIPSIPEQYTRSYQTAKKTHPLSVSVTGDQSLMFKGKICKNPFVLLDKICQDRNNRYPRPKYNVVQTSPGCFTATQSIGPVTAEGQGSSYEEARNESAKNMVHKILVEKVYIPSVPEQYTTGYYDQQHAAKLIEGNQQVLLPVKVEGNTHRNENVEMKIHLDCKTANQEIVKKYVDENQQKAQSTEQAVSQDSEETSAVNMKTNNKVMIGDPATDFLDTQPDASSSTLQDKSRKLFNSQHRSDIMFVVAKDDKELQEVYGHSLILGLATPTLESYFDNEWNGKSIIPLDCHASPFLTVIRFIYCQEIVFQEEYFTEILLLCMKFGVDRFLREIVSDERILWNDSWSILEFALNHRQFVDDKALTDTMIFVDKNINALILQEAFLKVPVEVIISLCKRPCLMVSESLLFQATVSWARKRCEEQGMEATPENLRTLMQPFIYDIRLPVMTGRDFKDGPAKTGILSFEECYRILCAIDFGDRDGLLFNCEPRVAVKKIGQTPLITFKSKARRSRHVSTNSDGSGRQSRVGSSKQSSIDLSANVKLKETSELLESAASALCIGNNCEKDVKFESGSSEETSENGKGDDDLGQESASKTDKLKLPKKAQIQVNRE